MFIGRYPILISESIIDKQQHTRCRQRDTDSFRNEQNEHEPVRLWGNKAIGRRLGNPKGKFQKYTDLTTQRGSENFPTFPRPNI